MAPIVAAGIASTSVACFMKYVLDHQRHEAEAEARRRVDHERLQRKRHQTIARWTAAGSDPVRVPDRRGLDAEPRAHLRAP